jgi:NAD+ synthetase
VNQVGGNDELVFDGHAAVFDPSANLISAAPGFTEHLLITDIPSPPHLPTSPPPHLQDPLLSTPDPALLFRALTLGIRDYLRKTGFSSAVLGLSGGIDSAVTAVLAAAALGPKNVLAVSLPSRFSSEGSKSDAHALASNLGIEFITIPIEGPFKAFESALAAPFAGRKPDVTEENLQSRIRGTTLMALSNKLGRLLLTTGNKSEMAVGYATLYGDMNGGLAVLSDVSKQWVYRLATWINANPASLGIDPIRSPPIPDASITKPPSAELRPNQTDQDTLPPYDILDQIIERYVEQRQSPQHIAAETNIDPATVARVVRMIDLSEFKRNQAAIGLKVTTVAFGSGRRMPIAQGYRPDRGLT